LIYTKPKWPSTRQEADTRPLDEAKERLPLSPKAEGPSPCVGLTFDPRVTQTKRVLGGCEAHVSLLYNIAKNTPRVNPCQVTYVSATLCRRWPRIENSSWHEQ